MSLTFVLMLQNMTVYHHLAREGVCVHPDSHSITASEGREHQRVVPITVKPMSVEIGIRGLAELSAGGGTIHITRSQ